MCVSKEINIKYVKFSETDNQFTIPFCLFVVLIFILGTFSFGSGKGCIYTIT